MMRAAPVSCSRVQISRSLVFHRAQASSSQVGPKNKPSFGEGHVRNTSISPRAAAEAEQPPSFATEIPRKSDLAMLHRKLTRKKEQLTYQFAALAATGGILFLAVLATVLRFYWHWQQEADFPIMEVIATLSLVGGGLFGMEMYARFAHKVLWHDFAPGWALHKSHHVPRVGPFEDNDIFAVMNGVPAIILCAYGFFTSGIGGGLCFGAGLGITFYGIMYMFIHDGLVHRRFPVGPIAQLPYMKRLAAAHQLHHANKYEGAPWGMFLAEQELASHPGAKEDLDRMVEELDWSKR